MWGLLHILFNGKKFLFLIMHIKVVAAIIFKDDKILIGRRASFESLPGWWEFPGGKPEKGESNEEAIRREIMEELEIKTQVGELIANYKHKFLGNVYELWFYKTKIISGKIRLNAHDKLEWIDPNDYSKFKLLPGDIPVLEKILSE